MLEIIDWIMLNGDNILTILAYLISASSVIVKLTPTLKDDHILKNVIKFLGKYVALNNKITEIEQKNVNTKK